MIEFSPYPPLRSGSHSNPLVRDVESHLSPSNYNYFKGDTVTTTVHECTHGINADLRNRLSTGENCFYLLDNQYVHFPEPNFRKRDVIPYIPDEYKSSSLYRIYVTTPHWDDRPLYLWDEWVAYINGAKTGASYSIENAIVFGYYAGAVIKKEWNRSETERNVVEYRETVGLHAFFDWLCYELLEYTNLEQTEKVNELQKWILQ